MIKISGKHRLPLAAFGLLLTFLVQNSAFAEAEDNSEFFKQVITDSMAVGQEAKVSITFKNTSANTWSMEKGYKLVFIGSDDPETWGISAISLPEELKVGKNGLAEFKFRVTAPTKAGVYMLQWQLANKELNQFGAKSPPVAIVVTKTDLQAKFVSQIVPNTLQSNSNYKVTMQFQNTGSSTWNNNSGFSIMPAKNSVYKAWGISSVQLPQNRTIAPGQSLTVNIPIKTPKKPGNYPFEWQMAKNGKVFGEKSPKINIRVESGEKPNQAEIVFQRVQSSMKAKNQYEVTVVVKNTGTSMWSADSVSLVSQAPAKNLDWFINNIEMQDRDMVLPGSMKSFTFKVVAPQKPGIYNFQWQLYDKDIGFFGPKTPLEQIRVTGK